MRIQVASIFRKSLNSCKLYKHLIIIFFSEKGEIETGFHRSALLLSNIRQLSADFDFLSVFVADVFSKLSGTYLIYFCVFILDVYLLKVYTYILTPYSNYVKRFLHYLFYVLHQRIMNFFTNYAITQSVKRTLKIKTRIMLKWYVQVWFFSLSFLHNDVDAHVSSTI